MIAVVTAWRLSSWVSVMITEWRSYSTIVYTALDVDMVYSLSQVMV